jgi:alkylated DNA repair protein alkB family protein 8
MKLNKAHKILEENKRVYNQISKEFSGSRNELWPEFEELKKYIYENEKILDLGCGNGRLYELFSEYNIDYTGIDFSEKLVEIAKAKYGDHFKAADILDLPFSNENFDSVWSIAVLHHIPSIELRKRVLSEIKRVLRPNGRVVVTCWKIKSLLRKDVFIPFHGQKRYYHVFSKKEIRKLFEESGFKIEEIRFLKRNNKKLNILVVATPQTG